MSYLEQVEIEILDAISSTTTDPYAAFRGSRTSSVLKEASAALGEHGVHGVTERAVLFSPPDVMSNSKTWILPIPAAHDALAVASALRKRFEWDANIRITVASFDHDAFDQGHGGEWWKKRNVGAANTMVVRNPITISSDMRAFVRETVDRVFDMTSKDLYPVLLSYKRKDGPPDPREATVSALVESERILAKRVGADGVLVNRRIVDGGILGEKTIGVYLLYSGWTFKGKVLLTNTKVILVDPLAFGFLGRDMDGASRKAHHDMMLTLTHELAHAFDPRLSRRSPEEVLGRPGMLKAAIGLGYAAHSIRSGADDSSDSDKKGASVVAGMLGRDYFASEHEYEAFTAERIEDWLLYLDETPDSDVDATREAMLTEIRNMARWYGSMSEVSDRLGDPASELRGKTFFGAFMKPGAVLRVLLLGRELEKAADRHAKEWLAEDVAWGRDRRLWRRFLKALYRAVDGYDRPVVSKDGLR